jgi:hypothetical protein
VCGDCVDDELVAVVVVHKYHKYGCSKEEAGHARRRKRALERETETDRERDNK